jgi:SAM-dependent methyltransferase
MGVKYCAMTPEAKIDAAQAAELLGISKASIRNWIKHDYLTPADAAGKHFFLGEILRLKADIETGKVNRLRQRANKTGAQKTFLPVEYLKTKDNQMKISQLADYIITRDIDPRLAIFVLALNLFKAGDDILTGDMQEILTFSLKIFRRRAVRAELKAFYQEITLVNPESLSARQAALSYLLQVDLPRERDILGILYQSLLREGKKSRLGSYFTPPEMVAAMVKDNLGPGHKALDPCCGTGQFLLSFAEFGANPEEIVGFDIDPLAVRIARINLLLKFPREFRPQVYQLDALGGPRPNLPVGGFDLVATNPPWGAVLTKASLTELNSRFPGIASGETFAYFLKAGIDWLNSGGKLSFILPEAILYVKTHADIRKYILDHCRIKKIVVLGRQFKNVLSPVIRLDLVKGLTEEAESGEEDQLLVVDQKERHAISQKRFHHNKGYVFDINLKKADEEIFNKIWQTEHITLEGNAEWALGIVTGNNKEYLRKEPAPGDEPIYKGSEVSPFRLKAAESFIRFLPDNFQQAAPLKKYRVKEKLIYRFISDSLVFAYDDMGSLTLNSANILIPASCYPLKVILALFNSSLYNFIFQKKFTSLKILRGDLEQLPLPLWDETVFGHITGLVAAILKGKEVFCQLDDYIMDQFSLSVQEKRYIRSAIQKKKGKG